MRVTLDALFTNLAHIVCLIATRITDVFVIKKILRLVYFAYMKLSVEKEAYSHNVKIGWLMKTHF